MNELSLNLLKYNYMLFPKKRKMPSLHISLGKQHINHENNMKYLGVFINFDSYNSHFVNKVAITPVVFVWNDIIFLMLNFLLRSVCFSLIIYSILQYGLIVWGTCNKTTLDSLT